MINVVEVASSCPETRDACEEGDYKALSPARTWSGVHPFVPVLLWLTSKGSTVLWRC